MDLSLVPQKLLVERSVVEWHVHPHFQAHLLYFLKQYHHVMREQVAYIANPEAVCVQHLAWVDHHPYKNVVHNDLCWENTLILIAQVFIISKNVYGLCFSKQNATNRCQNINININFNRYAENTIGSL